MDKLIATGLFGKSLLSIDQPKMIERYNACLREIDLQPTSLKRIHIDGWGWSPEVAAEQQNNFYLSHLGVANPYAIILSPEQKGRPIYFPYHSFDRDMMAEVFDRAEAQIADITTETALWIDVDQEISVYQSPQDLLMIDSILLRFTAANGLMDAVRHQREIAHKFNTETQAWSRPELHEQIIDSARKFGDLRFRNVDIPNIPYTKTKCFFTRAFGGMWVFRELAGGEPILIMEEEERVLPLDKNARHDQYYLRDPSLMQRLFREKLIDVDWDKYRKDIESLRKLSECILMDAAGEEGEISALLERGDRRRLIMAMASSGQLSPLYNQMERLIKQLQRGDIPSSSEVSTDLINLLAHPNLGLDKQTFTAVAQLLARLFPTNILRLYQYDKEDFFSRYQSWTSGKQLWAVEFLQREYTSVF